MLINIAEECCASGGDITLFQRMVEEVQPGAQDASDLIRAAWEVPMATAPTSMQLQHHDSAGKQHVVVHASHAGPHGCHAARASSQNHHEDTDAPHAVSHVRHAPAASTPAVTSTHDWLLALAGLLALRPCGARVLLSAPEVLQHIVDAFTSRGASLETMARCMNIFDSLTERHARDLVRMAGQRLVATLLRVAAGRAPAKWIGGDGMAEPAAAVAVESAADLFELPHRALVQLLCISRDECERGGAQQLSMAALPGAAGALVGVIEVAVARTADDAAALAKVPHGGSSGAGAQLPLPAEVQLAANLLELLGGQSEAAGTRWCHQAVAAGAIPVLLRALKAAGPSRAGAALAAAACVLLQSPDEDAELKKAGRRRSHDGPTALSERTLLQAAAWDTFAAALSGAAEPGGGVAGAAVGDAAPASCAVRAVVRLLMERPQAFFGFGAHPGALDALVRTVLAAPAAPPPRAGGAAKAADAAVRLLVLLATFCAAAGSDDLQQEWVMQMRRASKSEPAHRTARGALEFIEAYSKDEKERGLARRALGVLFVKAPGRVARSGGRGGGQGLEVGGARGRRSSSSAPEGAWGRCG